MSEDPADTGFGVSRQGALDLAARLGDAGSLADAFPAALLAPVWRALLDEGVIETPARVDPNRVEVLVAGPHQLELRVPVRSRSAELVKVVPVSIGAWIATGELANQIADEAERLANALQLADSSPVFEVGRGPKQKPHN